MVNANRAVYLTVAVFVAGIMAAFLAPVAINAMAGDEVASYNQSVSETVDLNPSLNATLDSIDDATTPNTATYTIQYDGSSTTASVQEGNNATVTVGGEDVTISPTDVGGTGTYAVTDYEYSTTAGWTNGAGALWDVLPLLIVLAIFLFITGMALMKVR